MSLNLLTKNFVLRRFWRAAATRVLTFVALAVSLTGCISSTAPILGDAKAILGEQIELHMFAPRDAAAPDGTLRNQGVATAQWNGGRYVVRTRSDLLSDFTIHAFEGRDLIMQTLPRAPKATEYALVRRLSDGVYAVLPLRDDVVNDGTREKFCTKTEEAPCRITTPEQLFVFARAMADNAEGRQDATIVVVLPVEQRR
jgi:hypothetical protein